MKKEQINVTHGIDGEEGGLHLLALPHGEQLEVCGDAGHGAEKLDGGGIARAGDGVNNHCHCLGQVQ